ncbi:MAG: YidC/Oxa1 family membrane protein insertase [Patescibacteria group bacterium]
MTEIFNVAIYKPIFNALFYLYHVIPGGDLGVSIILLTIAIKGLLFWPSLSSLKAQKSLQDTQPQIEIVKAKYKDDKEEMGRQLMKVYQDNKVNPFASCLPLLIQLPILIALYRVFFQGLQIDADTHILVADQMSNLYGYLHNIYESKPIHTMFLGFVDLTKTHNLYLAGLAAVAQYFSGRFLTTKKPVVQSAGSKDEGMAAAMNKQMLYLMPIMTIVIGYQFPAGVALYWLVSTVFTLAQQIYFFKLKDKWAGKESKIQVVNAIDSKTTK